MIDGNVSVVAHHAPYQRIDLGPRRVVPVVEEWLERDVVAANKRWRHGELVWGLLVQACGGER